MPLVSLTLYLFVGAYGFQIRVSFRNDDGADMGLRLRFQQSSSRFCCTSLKAYKSNLRQVIESFLIAHLWPVSET